jgi:hypothetical protein
LAATEHLLSTTDNPYNPFTEFDQWQAYDTQVGHHTLSLLARCTVTSDDLSELDQAQAIDYAMEEIIENNVSGMHIKVPDPASS